MGGLHNGNTDTLHGVNAGLTIQIGKYYTARRCMRGASPVLLSAACSDGLVDLWDLLVVDSVQLPIAHTVSEDDHFLRQAPVVGVVRLQASYTHTQNDSQSKHKTMPPYGLLTG